MSKFLLTLEEPENIPINFTFTKKGATSPSQVSKMLYVRPFNVLDEQWYTEQFGEIDLVTKIETKHDVNEVMQIFVHQLVDSDRATLAQALETDEEELVGTLMRIVPVDPNAEYMAIQHIVAVVMTSRSVSLPQTPGGPSKKVQRRQRWMKWLRWWLTGTGWTLIGFYLGRSEEFQLYLERLFA